MWLYVQGYGFIRGFLLLWNCLLETDRLEILEFSVLLAFMPQSIQVFYAFSVDLIIFSWKANFSLVLFDKLHSFEWIGAIITLFLHCTNFFCFAFYFVNAGFIMLGEIFSSVNESLLFRCKKNWKRREKKTQKLN